MKPAALILALALTAGPAGAGEPNAAVEILTATPCSALSEAFGAETPDPAQRLVAATIVAMAAGIALEQTRTQPEHFRTALDAALTLFVIDCARHPDAFALQAFGFGP